MKGNSFDHLTLKSPHYVSFLPSKRESPDHNKQSENSLHSSAYLNSNNSTRAKDYLNSFKFDFQRNKSPQPPSEPPAKYTFPSSANREPTVIDMMLGGSKIKSPDFLAERNLNLNPMNNINSVHSLHTSPNLMNNNNLFDKNLDLQSPKNNLSTLEDYPAKSKMNSEMFDSIMRHIDKKFSILDNRLKVSEEALATQQGERLADKMNFEKKEKEKEAIFAQERQKDCEKFNEELEKKEKKIIELNMKVSGLENKIQLYEEKINRFQNQNETKINNISAEIQTSLTKFVKNTKEMNSKIDLIYESPQVIFQKVVDDQEKLKRNNEDSLILNQKIGLINEDFKEKIKDLHSNIESLGQIVKRNNGDLGDQKLVINKIEEDFLKLLNFYKDLNEEIIKLKSFQDEVFRIKAKQGEIIGHLSNMKSKKKK